MVMNISNDVIIYLPGSLWLGLLLYTIPVMLPFIIYKELYRLEVNINGATTVEALIEVLNAQDWNK